MTFSFKTKIECDSTLFSPTWRPFLEILQFFVLLLKEKVALNQSSQVSYSQLFGCFPCKEEACKLKQISALGVLLHLRVR